MEPALDADFMLHERTIHSSRATMLAAYAEQIKGLDEQEHWALLVSKAREAGLGKEDLCRELSCAWSTVTRWMAGQTAPGPFARAAIKAKLLDMVETRMRDEEHRADAMEFAA